MLASEKIQFATILAATIVIPGLVDYALSASGYGSLGGVVWALSYGLGIVALWFMWLRPLDLTDAVDISS